MLKRKAEWNYKDTYSREALERVLRSYQTYYNIKTEAVEPPFAAEAIFGSHNEQYFLIKKAKVADIDTNETVYFATEESLSKERLLNWTLSPGAGNCKCAAVFQSQEQ